MMKTLMENRRGPFAFFWTYHPLVPFSMLIFLQVGWNGLEFFTNSAQEKLPPWLELIRSGHAEWSFLLAFGALRPMFRVRADLYAATAIAVACALARLRDSSLAPALLAFAFLQLAALFALSARTRRWSDVAPRFLIAAFGMIWVWSTFEQQGGWMRQDGAFLPPRPWFFVISGLIVWLSRTTVPSHAILQPAHFLGGVIGWAPARGTNLLEDGRLWRAGVLASIASIASLMLLAAFWFWNSAAGLPISFEPLLSFFGWTAGAGLAVGIARLYGVNALSPVAAPWRARSPLQFWRRLFVAETWIARRLTAAWVRRVFRQRWARELIRSLPLALFIWLRDPRDGAVAIAAAIAWLTTLFAPTRRRLNLALTVAFAIALIASSFFVGPLR